MLFEAKQKETKGRGADRGGEGPNKSGSLRSSHLYPIVEITNYLCYLGVFSC